MKKILSILLIAAGLIFLLMPFATDQIIKYYSKKPNIEMISKEEIKENNERKVEFDFSAVKDVEIASVISGARSFDKELMIGILTIPDLDIDLPIFKGLTDANLMAGAATMKSPQTMGQGNYTLSGHNMNNKKLLFGSLMDIEMGAKVFLTDKETTYEYVIYDIVVVPDTEFDMLLDDKADQRGKAIVSLMTCYHSSKTGKRFFALGELVDEYPAEL